MSTEIDEHLDELIARFASEDHTTVEDWKHRAVRSVVARRCQFEQTIINAATNAAIAKRQAWELTAEMSDDEAEAFWSDPAEPTSSEDER